MTNNDAQVTPAQAIHADARRALRNAMRAARAQLSQAQRQHCSERIAAQVAHAALIKPHSRIALFASLRDEPDSAPLLRLAAARTAQVCMPRIENVRAARMSFAPINGRWRINRFGIVEPAGSERVAARFLNVIFLPLLAFDDAGNRIGMGGGYYDRALAFRQLRRNWCGPTLIGVAYEFQQVAQLPALPHDVQLDGIVTPYELRWF